MKKKQKIQISKKILERALTGNRNAFLLSHFPKGGENEVYVDDFILVKEFNLEYKKWIVYVFTSDSLKKYKDWKGIET